MLAMYVSALTVIVAAWGSLQPERPDRPPPTVRPSERPDRQNQDGPWNHKIHFAISDDGLTFDERAEVVMLQASVPDIIELGKDLPKGAGAGSSRKDICIYAVDGRNTREPKSTGLVRLTSTDGKTWSQPQTITIRAKQGEFRGPAVDPSMVQLDDGRLRLYFYHMKPPGQRDDRPGDRPPGFPEPIRLPDGPDKPVIPNLPKEPEPVIPRGPDMPIRGDGPHTIYSAVSDDGMSFTLEEGERFKTEGITDPEVVRTGDQWLMFLSRGQEVLLARSGDGLNFERDAAFILRGGGVPGALVLSDGRVRVYQCSPEGVTSVVFDPKNGMFKPEEGVRMKGPCGDPAVWPRSSGGYVAVVKRFMKQPQRGPARYEPRRD